MKNIKFLILAIVMFPIFVFAEVPKKIRDNFKAKFPTAQHVKWQKESNGDYEANFKDGGISKSANFSKEGIWIETETAIEHSKIPALVLQKFNKLSGNAKIYAAAQIEAQIHKTWYEIEYKKGRKTIELFFDVDGNQVNK